MARSFRFDVVPAVGLFVLAFGCSAPPAAPVAPDRAVPPNLLLLTVDTLRQDHVSAYGYPQRTTARWTAA